MEKCKESMQSEELKRAALRLARDNFSLKRNAKLPELAEEEAKFRQAKDLLKNIAGFGGIHLLKEEYFTIEYALRELDLVYYDAVLRPAPRMMEGRFAGRPRIVALARTLVETGSGRVTRKDVKIFLGAYASKYDLTVGELRYFRYFLQAALLHCLSGVADFLIRREKLRKEAKQAAYTHHIGQKLISTLEAPGQEMGYLYELICYSKSESCSKQMQDEICEALENFGYDAQMVRQVEEEKRREMGWLMKRALSSLKQIRRWEDGWILKEFSCVFEIFAQDDTFCKMDVASQMQYAGRVEELARRFKLSERIVASRALARKRQRGGELQEYLEGDEARELGRELEARGFFPDLARMLCIAGRIAPAALSIALGWICATTPLMGLLVALLAYLPVFHLLDGYLMQLYARYWEPSPLSRLEIASIPKDARTLVLVAVEEAGWRAAQQQLDKVEIIYLSNRVENLEFGVVYPKEAGEAWRLAREVEKLNQKYGRRFLTFFVQGGKARLSVDGICRLLKGESGDYAYCIRLMKGDQLAPDSIVKLIGAALHPANQPQLGKDGRVVRGYGITQPRKQRKIAGKASSLYARLYAQTSLADIKRRFEQGIFGQTDSADTGVIHLAAAKKALESGYSLETGPQESAALRAGLSDVAYEGEPPKDAFRAVQEAQAGAKEIWRGGKNHKRFSLPGWKQIAETLAGPVCLLLLIFGYWVGGYVGFLAIAISVLTVFFEPVSSFNWQIDGLLKNVGKGPGVQDIWRVLRATIFRGAADFCLLPCFALAQIGLGDYRDIQPAHAGKLSAGDYYRRMWGCVLFGIGQFAFCVLFGRGFRLISLAFGILFSTAPFVAYWLGETGQDRSVSVCGEHRDFLMEAARRTWERLAEERPLNAQQTGWMLVNCLCARYLGFLDGQKYIERIAKLLGELESCGRWRGLFLNSDAKQVDAQVNGYLAASFLAVKNDLLTKCGGRDAEKLAARLDRLFTQMDFSRFLNEERQFFGSVLPQTGKRLGRCELFASEVILAVYIGVAKGDLPAVLWNSFLRPVVRVGSQRAFMSEYGGIAEYFAPLLFLPEYFEGAIRTSAKGCMAAQRAGKSREMIRSKAYGVPYGAPEISLREKGGQVETPYGAALAIWADAKAAVRSLKRFAQMGGYDKRGFCTAIDESALTERGRRLQWEMDLSAQSMLLAALCNALAGDALAECFWQESAIRSYANLTRQPMEERVVVIRDAVQ